MVHDDDSDLAADTLADMQLNSDRQVYLGGGNDWAVTDGVRNVKQSLLIHCGNTLRELIGSPLTGTTVARAEQQITQALQDDPQIENVVRASITDVVTDESRVEVTVFTSMNNSYELSVSP